MVTKTNAKMNTLFPPEQVHITSEQNISHTYFVHIDELITEASYYRNVLELLAGAGEDDTIVFRLSTDGGNLEVTLTILNAIRSTLAHTVSVIEASVASAGTLFPMVTDGVVVMPHGCMMFHPASYGYAGDMKTVKSFIDFHDKRLRNMLHDFYEGFFSETEINNLIDNSLEIWLGEDEIIDRLKKREVILEKKAKALLGEDDENDEDEFPPPPPKKRTTRKVKMEEV